MAGAARAEFATEGRGAKCCVVLEKMPVASPKSSLSCEASCGLTVPDHGRIVPGSSPHCK